MIDLFQRQNDFVQVIVDHGQEDEEEDAEKQTTDASNGRKILKKTLSNQEIIANALTMMTAGTDTTGNAIVYIAYNLAMYPDCQNKLFEEINEALEKTAIFLLSFCEIYHVEIINLFYCKKIKGWRDSI